MYQHFRCLPQPTLMEVGTPGAAVGTAMGDDARTTARGADAGLSLAPTVDVGIGLADIKYTGDTWPIVPIDRTMLQF